MHTLQATQIASKRYTMCEYMQRGAARLDWWLEESRILGIHRIELFYPSQ